MIRSLRAGALLVAALGVAAGCAIESGDDSSQGDDALRELERRAVGAPQAYPADAYGDKDAERFASSKQARRELGWRVVEKLLKPVTIAAQTDAGPKQKTIPLFRTWLGADELDRMFAKMYDDLGRDRRVARQAPTSAEVDALFAWAAQSLGANSEEDFLQRLSEVTSQPAVDGLAGNARVAYSPGYARQWFTDYAAVAACDGKLQSFDFSTPPQSDSNFTNCFSHEFAPDAAVVKASWRRNDEVVADGLPVQDTSAATLKKRLAREIDNGGWPQTGQPMRAAGPNDAYTVELESGARYSLAGLHIVTKELRHWVWVTIWWSPSGDEDFGQDRPDAIRALGGPWSNYKMCVVTDFDEKDPDPRGGFPGSLGDSLEAVHGPQTWCSNSFLEKGDHNAGTNCIGCHQHAGDLSAYPNLLKDETRFPNNARTKVRSSFPADYTWSFATPDSPDQKDRLQRMVLTRIHEYDRKDAQPK